MGGSGSKIAVDDGSGDGSQRPAGGQLLAQCLHLRRVAQVDAAGIAPIAVERRRQRQPRMRVAPQALDFRDGIADDLGDRHLFIHEAIHE